MKTMTKDLRFSRIVAFVLSLIVLLGSVDLNTIFDVLAENDAFSIVVKDTIDNPIEGATVTVFAETNTNP